MDGGRCPDRCSPCTQAWQRPEPAPRSTRRCGFGTTHRKFWLPCLEIRGVFGGHQDGSCEGESPWPDAGSVGGDSLKPVLRFEWPGGAPGEPCDTLLERLHDVVSVWLIYDEIKEVRILSITLHDGSEAAVAAAGSCHYTHDRRRRNMPGVGQVLLSGELSITSDLASS